MTSLKLIALEADDLAVISANLQDAVWAIGDMTYRPAEKRFVALLNRFDWAADADPTAANGANAAKGERRRAAFRVERVLSARLQGIDLARSADILSLLAVDFEPAPQPPGGALSLLFAGGSIIRLEVECVEAVLEDVGAAWRARGRPRHPDETAS